MKNIFIYFNEIFYLLGNNRQHLVWLVPIFLISSLLDVVGLGLIGPYLALVMNPERMSQGPLGTFLENFEMDIPSKDLFLFLGLGLVIVFLFKVTVTIFINWKILKFSRKCRVDLQGELMQAYQQQPYIEYMQRNSSEYVKTIHDATAHFVSSIQGLLRMLSEGIVCLFVLGFLSIVAGKVLGVLLILLGVTMFVYDRFFRRKAKVYGQRATEGVQRIVQGIHEGIVGFKELRILGNSRFFHKNVIEGAREVSDNWAKSTLISMVPRYLLEFILVSFVILFVLVSLVLGGDVDSIVPILGVFAVASLRLLPAASLVSGGISKLSYNRYAVSLLYNDLKRVEKYTVIKPQHKSEQQTRNTFRNLSLKNIGFQYPGTSQWALNDLTLSIKSGESIGIIGASGSGKTTLIDMLLGLLEPQKGSISYNQHPLKDVLTDWRSQVAYLPQEIFLVDNTLRCNIALGVEDNDIDETRIHEAIKQAHLAEMVKELPHGINTVLGEHGVRFSGGQRQRVALARAFYFERNVLVLDEATSALDHETEEEIIEEIKHFKGQKTMIVIAHRLSTVKHCDHIYKLKKGEVVEAGSYELVVGKKS